MLCIQLLALLASGDQLLGWESGVDDKFKMLGKIFTIILQTEGRSCRNLNSKAHKMSGLLISFSLSLECCEFPKC